MPPEEKRATVTGNKHRKYCEVCARVHRDTRVDRQTDEWTNRTDKLSRSSEYSAALLGTRHLISFFAILVRK